MIASVNRIFLRRSGTLNALTKALSTVARFYRSGDDLGGSSGVNIAGAVRLAKELGPGHTIVTILADYGTRYQSKLFNPEFLREKKLPVPPWLERTSQVAVPYVRT